MVAIAYKDTIIEHIAHNKIVCDNAKELISIKLKNVSPKYFIESRRTILYAQHQNYS